MSGKRSARALRGIRSQPTVSLDDSEANTDDLPALINIEDELDFEDGDRLFAVSMDWSSMPSEHIRATETISQRLAQAHAWNVGDTGLKGF